MSRLPIVAIVGRANVGKSSIFNRLVGQRQAIVANEPGTTRDSVTATVQRKGQTYRLVDTAGLKKPGDEFEASIQDQINEATQAADVILVTVEAQAPITDEDRQVIKHALKSGKPATLVINKIDQAQKTDVTHWEKTGIRTSHKTSTMHGTGFGKLEDFIFEHIPEIKVEDDTTKTTVALIGRPNVGKSQLFNAMLKKQQAVVADVAGTTRDVNRQQLTYYGQTIELLDTAGIRRPGKVERGVEHFSVLRTMQAIDEADVCLLVMDVNELNVTMDQKLAGIIAKAGKGLILVVSKWDSAEKDGYTHDYIAKTITHHYQHVWWTPLIFTSAVTGQNVTKLFELVQEIVEHRAEKMETKDLNNMLQAVMSHHPPAGKKVHPKLKYVTQTGSNPPTVTIHGRNTKAVHRSYKRFIEKAMRHNWDLSGTPVWIDFKEQPDGRR